MPVNFHPAAHGIYLYRLLSIDFVMQWITDNKIKGDLPCSFHHHTGQEGGWSQVLSFRVKGQKGEGLRLGEEEDGVG